MVQINPSLLKQPKVEAKTRAERAPRSQEKPSGFFAIVSLVKNAVSETLRTQVLNVKFDNQEQSINRIVGKLDSLNETIKSLPKIEMGESPASIQIQTMSEKTIARLTAQLEEVKKAVVANKPQAPGVQKVTVTNPTPVQKFDEDKIVRAIEGLERQVSAIKLEVPAQKEIKFPEMPKSMSMTEGKALLAEIKNLSKKFDDLPKAFPEIVFPTSVSVDNFPPQKYPMPVTHMSINSLAGFAKSNVVTVSTTAVPLPGEILAYRRSLVVYNNSSSVTLYVGGSDVTSSNGMPVPPNSYSPAFDAGPKMVVYGIAASSINVRVLELSDENSGR